MERFVEALASLELTTPLAFWASSVGLLLCIFIPRLRAKQGFALDLSYWKPAAPLDHPGKWLFYGLLAATSVLIALIAANPHITTKKNVIIYGRPVMLVVDVSGSMEYRGRPGKEGLSARERTQQVLDDLLKRNMDADLGLLLYSTENYIARSFAYKEALLKDTLENDDEISFIATGTRTAEALAKARTYFQKNEDTGQKAIVLISDLKTDLEAVMQLAEEVDRDALAGIKVYTIVTTGEEQWARKTETSQMAEERMTIIGMNDKTGIDRMCAEINAMESSPIRTEESLEQKSLIPYLVPPAAALVVLCLVLSETVYQKVC
jgi:hypothetical protein